MNAAPGELVVCVDDAPRNPGWRVLVRRRATYRVAANSETNSGQPAYMLEGVVGTAAYNRGKPLRYLVERFRKLNDSHDDAELIERIKNCQPVRVGENA